MWITWGRKNTYKHGWDLSLINTLFIKLPDGIGKQQSYFKQIHFFYTFYQAMHNQAMTEEELLSIVELQKQIQRILFGKKNKCVVSNKIWHMQTIG